jgi:site-specific DNA-methyltransferase (adenine-specific)
MQNQIIKGDCFEVLKDFPDGTFDAIITDPPYLYLKHKLDAFYDEQTFIDLAWRLLLKNSMFCFFGRGESFYKSNYLANQKGFKFKEEIIWDKVRISSPMLSVGRCHETSVIYSKGKIVINRIKINKLENDSIVDSHKIIADTKRILTSINSLKSIDDLSNFKSNTHRPGLTTTKHGITIGKNLILSDRGSACFSAHQKGINPPSIMRFHSDHYNYLHPTQKPLELIKRLIELTTKEGGLILDPFAGSGTLAIACLETNRRYVCIEQEDDYFEIMQNRINKWHNDKLNATGTHELPEDIERIVEEKSGQLNLF